MTALLTIAIAFCVTVFATRALMTWLQAQRLVAVENDRTMHVGAVPQGGGAAVVTVALGTAIILWPWSSWHTVIVPTTVALAGLSAANDRQDIAFQWRLAAHLAAAVLLVMLVPSAMFIFGGAVPWLLDRLIGVIALAWFINLYNFMDGIDGIAGTETMSLAGGALALSWTSGTPFPLEGLALAVVGASAGFLVWNWHKAQIFLGDVGSIPLGFLTGAILLHIAVYQSLAAALILPLYYLTDATLTLARRFWRGEKLSQAHRSHAYQRSARAVGSHSAVVLRIALCNGALIGAAMIALAYPWAGLALATVIVAALLWHLETIATSVPVLPTVSQLAQT